MEKKLVTTSTLTWSKLRFGTNLLLDITQPFLKDQGIFENGLSLMATYLRLLFTGILFICNGTQAELCLHSTKVEENVKLSFQWQIF